MKTCSLLVICWILTLPGLWAGERALRVAPVSEGQRPGSGSAGLFVGVNVFRDESLTPLRYAVNDAVMQADLFVNQLRLLPAGGVELALSGTPEGAAGSWSEIAGYNDGHPVTAPVEQSWENPWGLFGVGGNVWEATASDASNRSFGAWRGGSWDGHNQVNLRVSFRNVFGGSTRYYNFGFRLVLSR